MNDNANGRIAGRQFALVLLGALVVRAGFVAASWPAFEADPDGYRLIAGVVRTHNVFGRPARGEPDRIVPTAYRPPLYPLVLAILSGATPAPPAMVAALHLSLGVATVGLVWVVAARNVSSRTAWCPAAMVAVDPILLNQSAQVMTETLAALLAIAVVAALATVTSKQRYASAVVAGVCLGLAALCRPTFLPLVPLAVLTLVMRSTDRVRAIALAVTVLIVAALTVAPWTVRNRITLGRWIITTTHGGYTLLLGNNSDFYRYLREGRLGEVWTPHSDDELMDHCRAMSAERTWPPPGTIAAELADDELAYRCARRMIREQPGMFAWACVYRVGQFWSPLPHARSTSKSWGARLARYLVAVWYVLVFMLAVAGCAHLGKRMSRSPWCWSCLAILCFVAAHTAYWSNLRMRGPIMPLVGLLAGVGVHHWCVVRNRARGDVT